MKRAAHTKRWWPCPMCGRSEGMEFEQMDAGTGEDPEVWMIAHQCSKECSCVFYVEGSLETARINWNHRDGIWLPGADGIHRKQGADKAVEKTRKTEGALAESTAENRRLRAELDDLLEAMVKIEGVTHRARSGSAAGVVSMMVRAIPAVRRAVDSVGRGQQGKKP